MNDIEEVEVTRMSYTALAIRAHSCFLISRLDTNGEVEAHCLYFCMLSQYKVR